MADTRRGQSSHGLLHSPQVISFNLRLATKSESNTRRPAVQVYHIKKLVKSLQEKNEVLMVVDLHGHSQRFNVFSFGVSEDEFTHPG